MASFIAPLIGGLAGLFGGGQQQKTQTSGTITNNTAGTFNQGGTAATNYNLSPLQSQLMNAFGAQSQNLYNSATNLQPYAAQQLQQINGTSNVSNQILQNSLASRGLSYSPVAATATTQGNLARVSQQNQFMQNLPLLQRQLQTQALGGEESAFSAMPKNVTQTTNQSGATTQSGTQTQQGTNLISGNQLGGLFGGLGAGLFAPNGDGSGSNLSSILGSLFGNNSSSSAPFQPTTGPNPPTVSSTEDFG